MIFFGARLGFTSIGRIIVTIIAIYEFIPGFIASTYCPQAGSTAF